MHTSCLHSVFVFNASAFIFDIFFSDTPITWSGLLPSALRECIWYSVQIRIPFSFGKIACKLDTWTHLSQSEIKKDCCLFVLPEKKMSSNLGHSSQYKFTLKTSNVQFKRLPMACSSKRSAYWEKATVLQFFILERMLEQESGDPRSRSFLLITSYLGLITYPLRVLLSSSTKWRFTRISTPFFIHHKH